MITVHVGGGTLSLSGPADLLGRPADDEIKVRIAANLWNSDFHRLHVEGQHRLGHIETRLQLEFLCTQQAICADFGSYCYRHGVLMTANPRPRGRRR
jgi:hypothetical protein